MGNKKRGIKPLFYLTPLLFPDGRGGGGGVGLVPPPPNGGGWLCEEAGFKAIPK